MLEQSRRHDEAWQLGELTSSHRRLLRLLDKTCSRGEKSRFLAQLEGIKGSREVEEHLGTPGFLNKMAGVWAAKEAVVKAVNYRRLHMREVEVRYEEVTRPYAVILDKRAGEGEEEGEEASGQSTLR